MLSLYVYLSNMVKQYTSNLGHLTIIFDNKKLIMNRFKYVQYIIIFKVKSKC